jgi:hypothetical protein
VPGREVLAVAMIALVNAWQRVQMNAPVML